jgi:predicted GNAT superfamily acetyltransferase
MRRKVVLALNNVHAVELSWLDEAKLNALLAEASYARGLGDVDAVLGFTEVGRGVMPGGKTVRYLTRRIT